MRVKFGFIILLIVFVFSCKKKINKNELVLGDWIGKKFITAYNDSLFMNLKYVSEHPLKKEFKIITFLDAGCKCIEGLSKWKNVMKKIDTSKVGYLFVLHSDDKLYSFKHTDSTKIHLNYPYYFDRGDSIRLKNKIPFEKLYQTFLLDKNDKVILLGDPSLHSKIEELYIKTIN